MQRFSLQALLDNEMALLKNHRWKLACNSLNSLCHAHFTQVASPYSWATFSALTLLIQAFCYVMIIVNVERSPHSDHRGSIHVERKLSITLLMVTGVSVLTILPYAVYHSMPVNLQKEVANSSGVEIKAVLAVIRLASSIVNPLVYAIRMQEFRKAVWNLVCKITEPTRVIPLQPHAMP